MDIHRHPELLDRLAAAYALGTMRGGARRRFETLAREHPSVRVAALLWQGRVESMNELQRPETPSPAVWPRIANLLRAEREQAAMAQAREASPAKARWWGSLPLWRGGAVAGALATVMAVVSALNLRADLGQQVAQLQAELAATPQIEYVAVLQDAQASAEVLVTFDPKSRRLTLQRVGGYQEAADKSLQLWALPPGDAPRSLGVLGNDRLLQLATDQREVGGVPALAISLEPLGGVPSETGPTGPVLFKGALIQKML